MDNIDIIIQPIFTNVTIEIDKSNNDIDIDVKGATSFIPTDLLTDYGFYDKSIQWNIAYNWGDHSLENYLKLEDISLVATSNDYNDLDNKPDISGIATNAFNLNQHLIAFNPHGLKEESLNGTVVNPSIFGSSYQINLNSSVETWITLTQNMTFTETGLPANGESFIREIYLKGNFTFTSFESLGYTARNNSDDYDGNVWNFIQLRNTRLPDGTLLKFYIIENLPI